MDQIKIQIEMIPTTSIDVETMIWIIIALSFIQLAISCISLFKFSKRSKGECGIRGDDIELVLERCKKSDSDS